METDLRSNLHGLKVISFESRRAKEMAELIRRYGGEPFVAASMREIPLHENQAALSLLTELESGKFDFLILMTGVGTKTLNEVFLTRYSQERIKSAFQKVQLVARGPKPVAALKELGLQPAIVIPEPNTWREILASLDAIQDEQPPTADRRPPTSDSDPERTSSGVNGKRIVIQEYGIPNAEFVSALQSRGAEVVTVPIYRWALPEDIDPLRQAIQLIVSGEAKIVLFTNGAQAGHLFKVAADQKAEQALRDGLKKIVVGSVGPVCTEVLGGLGVKPDIEPKHPKMGALLAEIAATAHRLIAAKDRA